MIRFESMFADFSQMTSMLVMLLLLVIIGRATYNLYLHPLAKIPGPFFARISGIPSWYHALKGDRHVWLWQIFQVYGGDRIRPEPNTVIFLGPEASRDIHQGKANVERSDFYLAWAPSKRDCNTMQTIGKAQHAAKRKVLNLSFTEKSIKSTSEFVFKHIDRWHELMVDNDNWSVPFDLSDSVHNLLFDVQGDICFGASFNTKEPGENAFRKMPHMILEIMLLYYPLVRSPLRGLLLWLKSLGLDNLLERYSPPVLNDYHKFVHDSVTKRIKYQEELRQNPEIQERLDMFHYLCEARDPDSGQFVHDEHSLRAEAALIMVAGSDTTATIFTATMFYLSLPSQAHRLQKVVKEIRFTFDAAEDIKTGPQLSSCTYLLACIEEAMRLAPAAPSELPRVVREGGAVIKGEFYPAGTIVGTSNYADGRNEQFYEDCHDYRPERWIVSDHVSHEEVTRARSNFRPFGSGPLNCAGKKLAMIELLALVGRTLWRFDMRRAPGARLTLGGGSPDLGWGQRDPDQFRLIDAYMTLHEGPMLQLRKRVI